VAAAPFFWGMAALAGTALVIELAGINDLPFPLRYRHPAAGLELLLTGWCVFFATRQAQKAMVMAALLAVCLLHWRDVTPGGLVFMLAGTAAVLWGLRLPLPAPAARALMQAGSLAMFIYLAHVPAISLSHMIFSGQNALRFLFVTMVAAAAAWGIKKTYDLGAELIARMARAARLKLAPPRAKKAPVPCNGPEP
jgi:hypothetical protein